MTAGRHLHVNGIDLYYEEHGPADGRPLVALHGGLLTAEMAFGALITALPPGRRVIAPELQGHGHTADSDREFRIGHLAEDVLGLLDHLGIERADLLGFSLGGYVALELAISHPARVDHLVLASTNYRPDGYHDEIRRSELHPGSTRMPTERDFAEMREAHLAVSPEPDHFDDFAAKASGAVGAFEGWPAEALRRLAAPTLLVVGDHDFVRLDHAVEMYELIPDARLAVLPRTTHMDVMRRTRLLVPLLEGFLPSAGA
ncbi:alpha/beta fold hydrolase [Kitasatospora sp. NPDC051914]|uniref:alpha/beta fold hydrolase n=1 Tax=Kitasatospora sp. NPDC051914 TaxID=3154945 RepID=UPI00343BDCF0